MSLPVTEAWKASAAVLAAATWTQAIGESTQTINTDGSGNGKASGIDAATDVIAYRADETFSADHWCSVFINGGLASTANFAELALRAANDGATSKLTAYYIYTDGLSGATHTEWAKWVDGAVTIQGNFAVTFATGDEMLASISTVGGNATIKLYKRSPSGFLTLIGTVTDATAPITRAGAPGCGVFNGAANNVLLGGFRAGNGDVPAEWKPRSPSFPPGRHPKFPRRMVRRERHGTAAVVATSTLVRRTLNPFGTRAGNRTRGK